MPLLEIFPGDKEQFQVARLRYQPRNLTTVDHNRRHASTVFLNFLEWLSSPFGRAETRNRNRANSITVFVASSIRGTPVSRSG